MAEPITPYGRKWELSRSVWIVWVFFPFALTAFISFLYVGVRMQKRKWIVSGIIYFIVMFQYFFVFSKYPIDHIYFDLSIGLVLAGWIISCMHAVLIRREYLRLLAKEMGKNVPTVTPQINIKKSVALGENLQSIPKKGEPSRSKTKSTENNPKVININTATQKEIAALPSIGNILASEIVQVRSKVGSFQSFQHLVKELNMKPHVLAKAKPYITFSSDKPKDVKKAENNNNNDHPKHTAGRVVDY